MNIFGIGLPEMALILVLALLVFGPKKLPEIGRSLAQALNSFKKAQQEFESEFRSEAEQIQKAMTEPMKASIEKPALKALQPQKAESGAEVSDRPSEPTSETKVEGTVDADAGDAAAVEVEIETNAAKPNEPETASRSQYE